MSVFGGCGAALVTPFDGEGHVNYDELEKLLMHVCDGGVSALFACGTTGEPSTLTKAEKEGIIEACVKFVRGKIPVFAGCGSNNTAEAVALAKKCEQLGASGLLVVTPYYNKCTQAGAYLHYKTISEAVGIPIIAYNVPSRTGFNMSPDTALRLSELRGVVGIKEASGNIDQIMEIARLTRGALDLYCGDDSLIVPAMAIGAKGVISVAANVIPDKIVKLTNLCAAEKYHEAAALSFEIQPFIKKLFCEVNPIPCKAALKFIGIDAGLPRLPLTELEPKHIGELKDEMIKLGLFK